MKGHRNQPNMMGKSDLLDPKLMAKQQTMQALLGPHQTIDPLTGRPIIKDTTTVHQKQNNAGATKIRPLFQKGPNWNLQKYLAFMKSKTEVNSLPELHFFDGTEGDLHPDTMVMASFPRSGNTMLRAYLERITGIVTGSDVDIELGLNAALMEEGLEGEGMIDSRVWVVKTHYPERHGVCMYFPKRCIMVLRDPIDCIPSLFHLTLTDSHDLSVIDEDFFTFQKQWLEYVEQEVTVWRDFHEYWLKSGVPTHIIRYEDMCKRPRYAMTELMKFMFKMDSLEGTVIGKYVELATEVAAPQKYKPRAGKTGAANIDKLDQDTLDFMAKSSTDILKKLGFYQNYRQPDSAEFGANNPFAWFEEHNRKTLEACMKKGKRKNNNAKMVHLNEPTDLLRTPTPVWPKGRNWIKIIKELKSRVTTVGRTLMKVDLQKDKDARAAQQKAMMEAKEHVQLYKPAKATDKKVEGEIKLTYIAPPTAQEILERKKQEEQQRLLELEEAKKKEAEDQLNLGKEAKSEESTTTGEAKIEEKSQADVVEESKIEESKTAAQ